MIPSKKRLFLNFFVHIFFHLTVSWLKKQPLPIARCHGQLITNSNSFYFIGGCTELNENENDENNKNDRTMLSLNLLDKYDIRQDTWITETHMKQARHDLCAEIIGMVYFLHILF
jgi:N-acetylneuraminic acid mutarotase